jgi:hypothetical protein
MNGRSKTSPASAWKRLSASSSSAQFSITGISSTLPSDIHSTRSGWATPGVSAISMP